MHTYAGRADMLQLWLTCVSKRWHCQSKRWIWKKQTWCCQTQQLFEGLSLKPVHGRFSDICCCCSLESFSLTFIRTLEMSFSTDGKQWWNFQLWSKELNSFTLFSTASWPCHTHNFESWAADTLEHVTNRHITTTCSIVAQV